MNRSNEQNVKPEMRRDKQPGPHTRDSYRSPERIKGSTRCGECGALYEDGRWIWRASSDALRQLTCPACRRIQDHSPAGEFVLTGEYLAAHRDDLVALLRRQAAGEEKEHPLERIMEIDEQPDRMTVRTTGPHLVRRLGEAVLRAHGGHLTLHYRDGEGLLRADWQRPGG